MTTILATIFVLGVLIFFHELGHFLLAKWAGIKVEKFSLGFPPKLISKKWGETEYVIGVVPLGGYVKMAGDNPHEETEGKPWEFMSKPIWKRFLVIFAGPFMNFLLAVVVLAGLYAIRGKEADSIYVGNVISDSPAAIAGIRSGDNILTVEKYDVRSYAQLSAVIEDKVEQPVVIKWQRDEIVRVDTIVTAKEVIANSDGDSVAVGDLGLGEVVIVGGVESGKPAEQAGIQMEDIIISVDKVPVKSFTHMASMVYPKMEEPVEISWRRGEQVFTKSITTFLDTAVNRTGDTVVIGLIGFRGKSVYERLNVLAAVGAGFNQSVYYVEKVIEFVWGLINRTIDASEVGGPIFISKLAGQTARAGMDILLEFLALLSINLAVLNILPIPILDGSHIVFLLWEKIKGSPPSVKTRVIAQQIGLAFMLILIVFVTFNDITR